MGLFGFLLSVVYPYFVASEGFYKSLYSAQSRPNTTLASMPDLVVLGNADLHKPIGT